MDQASGIPRPEGVPVCAVCGGMGNCEFCPRVEAEPPRAAADGVPSADAVETGVRARAGAILWGAIDQQDAAATVMKERANELKVTLEEELALTAKVAVQAPESHARYAARTLRRLLDEDPSLSLEEAALAASALAALGGRGHAEALSTLRGVAGRSTRRH